MKVFCRVLLCFIVLYLITPALFAQENNECWKLNNEIWAQHIEKPDKMPRPLLSADKIAAKFLDKVDKSKMKDRIFVSFIVDDFGDVKCPRLEKGNNNETDITALEFVKTLKFKPAQYKGKKISFRMTMPLPKPALKYGNEKL